VMHASKVVPLKTHRGALRFWAEGVAPLKAGFTPGARFIVTRHGAGVLLKLDETGPRKVSKKQYASGKEMPVIDVNSSVLDPLKGHEVIRAVFGPGQVYLTPLASEVRRQRRLVRLKERLTSGDPLATMGVAAGGGVLTHATHTGLADEGVDSEVVAHNEIREDLSDHALDHNDALSARTQILNMPLQELAFDDEILKRVGEVDIVELGLPCSGASKAGRAKRALSMPEEHPDVGHLVVGALALLAKLNPAVCLFENVPPYAKSASAQLIRQHLRDSGYDTHEIELFGPDFGALEARRRWCLVGVTKGILFDIKSLMPAPFEPQTLSDIFEPPEAVANRWSTMPGLKAKQVRDIDEGKGFRMQIYDGPETEVNTLTKGIAKNRSTDPKFRHPDNPELLRIPTAREHARCKGVPEQLIEGLSQTTAHELLGQGIVYQPFRQVARHIGRALKAWARDSEVVANSNAFKVAA